LQGKTPDNLPKGRVTFSFIGLMQGIGVMVVIILVYLLFALLLTKVEVFVLIKRRVTVDSSSGSAMVASALWCHCNVHG
jgi:hypothetical protein